jgi:hypothetical protein
MYVVPPLGGDVVLSWEGVSNMTYAVESTPDLAGTWNDVITNIPAVSGSVSATTEVSSATEIYRAYVE